MCVPWERVSALFTIVSSGPRAGPGTRQMLNKSLLNGRVNVRPVAGRGHSLTPDECHCFEWGFSYCGGRTPHIHVLSSPLSLTRSDSTEFSCGQLMTGGAMDHLGGNCAELRAQLTYVLRSLGWEQGDVLADTHIFI